MVGFKGVETNRKPWIGAYGLDKLGAIGGVRCQNAIHKRFWETRNWVQIGCLGS